MGIEKTRQEIHKFKNKFYTKGLHATVSHAIIESNEQAAQAAKEEEE